MVHGGHASARWAASKLEQRATGSRRRAGAGRGSPCPPNSMPSALPRRVTTPLPHQSTDLRRAATVCFFRAGVVPSKTKTGRMRWYSSLHLPGAERNSTWAHLAATAWQMHAWAEMQQTCC